VNNVVDPGKDVISGRGSWHGDGAGQPHNGVHNVLCLSVHSPYSVAVIRVQGWAKVPAINAMGCPTVVYTGLFMDDDTSAQWGNGGAVEVERSMELCPSG